MQDLVDRGAQDLQLFQSTLMQVYRAMGAALAPRLARRHTAMRLEQP
jgi:hypothetical protein